MTTKNSAVNGTAKAKPSLNTPQENGENTLTASPQETSKSEEQSDQPEGSQEPGHQTELSNYEVATIQKSLTIE